MNDFEQLGRQAAMWAFRAIGLVVVVQVGIVVLAVVGVALEFMFGPTPLGRIALFILLLEFRLLGFGD